MDASSSSTVVCTLETQQQTLRQSNKTNLKPCKGWDCHSLVGVALAVPTDNPNQITRTHITVKNDPQICPLTSVCVPWYGWPLPHIHAIIINKKWTKTQISKEAIQNTQQYLEKILNIVNQQGNANQYHSVTLSECLLQRKHERLKAWIRMVRKGTCILWWEHQPATHCIVYQNEHTFHLSIKIN